MNEQEQEWVAQTLKEYERKQCISKLLSTDCNDAVPKGNNFSSEIYRLNLKVVLNCGEVVTRSVIYKMLPKSETSRNFIKLAHLKELKMFRYILPEIERIRSGAECGATRITPICYGIRRGYEGCLMEDLSVSGFKMADRRKGLDFHHAKLVMETIAEFHAGTRILIERGDLPLNEFSDTWLDILGNSIENAFRNGLKSVIKSLEENWSEEWMYYTYKLKDIQENFRSKLDECLKINDMNFNTLIHGDFWTTNMMFKYKDGQPQEIRLLDFQLSGYNNIGIDLAHFFNSSLDLETYPRKPELLHIYWEKLIASLSLYGFSGFTPTFEDISQCYERASIWGLILGLTFRPQDMKPPEEVYGDLEEWTKDFCGSDGLKTSNLEDEEVKKALGCILKGEIPFNAPSK